MGRKRALTAEEQSILDEIHEIRDRTVASRVKVDGPEWRAAVKRCRDLRRELRRLSKRKEPVKRMRRRVSSIASFVDYLWG